MVIKQRLRFGLALVGLLAALATKAAEISGVPPTLPPGIERKLEAYFGNDFFGRGGVIDDFRTQQFTLISAFGERWSGLVDHSVLTVGEPSAGSPGRLDQLSGSLGYRILGADRQMSAHSLDVGLGFRYSGKLEGARIQNGYHQVTDGEIKTMPYVATRRMDGTVWARYEFNRALFEQVRIPGLGGGWNLGYWARASGLATTDSQFDGRLFAAVVASRGWFQVWVGPQGDWRNGYDRDIVTRDTARYEDGLGAVFGFRLGPLIFETEQQFNGDSAYGHVSLVSTGESFDWSDKPNESFGLQAGITAPDVYFTLQGRWRNCGWFDCASDTRKTWVIDGRYGKPQFGSATDRFVETLQFSALFELEQVPLQMIRWMSVYSSIGPGWRSERLEGDSLSAGAKSSGVSRFGLAGDIGLRFSTSAGGSRWAAVMQAGLTGWLPTSSGRVLFLGQAEKLQTPEVAAQAGVVLSFR